MYTIIAQTIGIIGMTFNILSYQGKNAKIIMAMQAFGGVMFSINYFMLGAVMGGLTNILCIARSVFFIKKKDPPGWSSLFFTGFMLIFYIMTFTVFGTEITLKNLIVEFLPVIGITVMTYGFCSGNDKFIRKCGLVNSPCFLCYNLCCRTIGGIVCEAFSIISIVIGMMRYKKRADDKDTNGGNEA